ncbi:hypothetical protein GQX74_013698 [Glossina fuscipes]|nr:hypothetical protein GQX74_013698 [Glossina fuscipes]
MKRQVHLSKSIRTLLVDWILEIQETFKLSHEILYVTVMLVDVFLCEVVTNKDKMQLLGAPALLTASKFHEVTFPLARYILELFLMDYDTITFSYSTTGAAALFVTSRMVGEKLGWNIKIAYFAEIVTMLNKALDRKLEDGMKTIRNKIQIKNFIS